MEQNTLEITEQSEVFEFASIRELVNQALKKDFDEQASPAGLTTGFRMLDNVIGGFQKGQLYTVAVKPGMGKTAFLLSVANNLAIKNNHSVAIFSSERSNLKITNRLIESETGMSLEKLRKGTMKASERDHMNSLISSIAKAKIFLDDTPSLSAEELIKRSRQLKIVHNVDLVIIDYLELLSTSITDTDSRSEQLNKIVLTVKEIARELNLPILLFSQIGSPFNFMQKPTIKDLPVFLSELSDSVMFLHRSDLFPSAKNGINKDIVEVIVAKHPQLYEPVVVPLTYIESIAKFADFS
ncbi:MAG: DnaB-like helicase C-terminal domain-containing protein [Bacteroidales bacterium]|nr:DnaB-like helicase C-terminal domain-containing protein [Bacteroidales bacterium]